jgi:hypothetical protein
MTEVDSDAGRNVVVNRVGGRQNSDKNSEKHPRKKRYAEATADPSPQARLHAVLAI